MITTTLNEIRKFDPRQTVWETLLSYLGKTQPDDEPLPLVAVLDSNGLNDALWCLRVCPDIAAEFAQWCAVRTAEAAYWVDRAAHGANRVAEAAEAAGWAASWAADAAYWVDRAAHGANRVADRASLAAEAAGWAAEAAEAAGWAADWAAAGATERQAQADKLRGLLT